MTEMLDGQTAVLVFQTYYSECMQEQAKQETLEKVLDASLSKLTTSLIHECVK